MLSPFSVLKKESSKFKSLNIWLTLLNFEALSYEKSVFKLFP